jgi:prolyl oligopeptidase
MSSTTESPFAATPASESDPYEWLEDVLGERALAWVRARNAESEKELCAEPGFDRLRERIREVLDSREQIPYVTRRGPWLYNLWQDAANPRGLWRRTTLAEFRKPEPAWQTLIDLDALGRAEGNSWVWAGATAHGPQYRRALVQLSVGGADARIVREFDLEERRFVEGGFDLPEAKCAVDWIGENEIVVATDFGPGSMTTSGYPRIIKRWQRGEPLAAAQTVFEGESGDVGVGVSVDDTPGFERMVFSRATSFYTSRVFLQQGLQRGAALVPIEKPDDAQLGLWRQWLLIELRSDWAIGGRHFRAGSLLVADAAAYLGGAARAGGALTVVFEPSAARSLAAWTHTRSTLIVNILDNVASRLVEWRHVGGAWQSRTIAAPYPGTLSVSPLHDPLAEPDALAEQYWLNAADFLAPDSLQLGQTGSDERITVKARPSFFDAEGMRAEQRFATSRDGTRVPYFVVWPRGAAPAAPGMPGDHPTLLHGYGGFEISQQPSYSGILGRAWAERGGVYVLANIRGGGEFGPAWHQAALKANRQKAFDDFIAVAEDLVAARITQPRRLAIQGGSNGGLLVAAVALQRPDLLGAVLCKVPLADMRRYHKLLAGASWMAEYGDPDRAEDWAYLSRYSPYHNVPRAAGGKARPAWLLTTSTRDDRVHPAHARKLAASLIEHGHEPLYWENIEGGHGGAADNAQRARMKALEFSFLWQQLSPP